MVPFQLNASALPRPESSAETDATALVNYLRFVAMGCRAKPRTDLFEACALLHVTRSASLEAHSEALMRCLSEALGKPIRLLAPGTAELTFDEQWLLRLSLAHHTGDAASVRFLLASRVTRQHRRLVQFLVARISECFSPN